MEFRLLFILEARFRKIRLVMVEILLAQFRDTRAKIDIYIQSMDKIPQKSRSCGIRLGSPAGLVM